MVLWQRSFMSPNKPLAVMKASTNVQCIEIYRFVEEYTIFNYNIERVCTEVC